MLFNLKLSRGFTLVEILIVIAILGILTGIIINSTLNFRRGAALNTETERVVAILNQARTQTLSSLNDLAYGVYFTTNTVAIFSGSTYVASSVGEQIFNLDPQVIISNINLDGGQEVGFARLSGRSSASGNLSLTTTGGSNQRRVVIIYLAGIVSSK